MRSRTGARTASLSAKRYRLGFSPVGCIGALIPLIPNVFWALLPPVSSDLPANESAVPFVGALQSASQVLMIALLMLVIDTRRRSTTSTTIFAAVGATSLIGYLLLWVLYFTTPITPMLLVLMAILPSAYFVCLGLYLGNHPSLAPVTLFALLHIATTAENYL
ncbi:MAG: hypothetical protein ACQEWM_08795 [Actinomycetota bacterium]